jgi:anti-anti-sigma regulatory factor
VVAGRSLVAEGRRVGSYKIETAEAGPYVTVMTISGTIENGAELALRRELEKPETASRRVVVDLTEAVLYDSWPFPLLAREAKRLEQDGGQLVVVSGDNGTVKPFVADSSLPALRWFESLDDAMVDLLGNLAKLGDWPPQAVEGHADKSAAGD